MGIKKKLMEKTKKGRKHKVEKNNEAHKVGRKIESNKNINEIQTRVAIDLCLYLDSVTNSNIIRIVYVNYLLIGSTSLNMIMKLRIY